MSWAHSADNLLPWQGAAIAGKQHASRMAHPDAPGSGGYILRGQPTVAGIMLAVIAQPTWLLQLPAVQHCWQISVRCKRQMVLQRQKLGKALQPPQTRQGPCAKCIKGRTAHPTTAACMPDKTWALHPSNLAVAAASCEPRFCWRAACARCVWHCRCPPHWPLHSPPGDGAGCQQQGCPCPAGGAAAAPAGRGGGKAAGKAGPVRGGQAGCARRWRRCLWAAPARCCCFPSGTGTGCPPAAAQLAAGRAPWAAQPSPCRRRCEVGPATDDQNGRAPAGAGQAAARLWGQPGQAAAPPAAAPPEAGQQYPALGGCCATCCGARGPVEWQPRWGWVACACRHHVWVR